MKIIGQIFNRIKQNQDLSAVLSNASFLMGENFLRLILGFGVGIFVARHLGPENYGRFSYVLSFVLMFSPFFVMGIDEIITKDLVRDIERRENILGTAAFIKFLGGIVGVFITVGAICVIKPDDYLTKILVVFYSASCLLRSLDVVVLYHQSILKMKRIAIIRSIALIIVAVAKLVLIVLEMPWSWFVIISCLELVLFGACYIFAYNKSGFRIIDIKVSFDQIFPYLKVAWPVFASLFVAMLLSNVDQILVGEFAGPFELGQYATSSKLIFLWRFLPLAIMSSIFPKIIESKDLDYEQYNHRVKLLYGAMLWFSILFAVSVSVFGRWIVLMLYGEAFDLAGKLLQLQSWVTVLYFYTLVRTQVFVIEGHLKISLVVALFTVVCFFSFSFYFIPSYKAYGAIISMIASYVVSNILVALFSEELRKDLRLFVNSFYYPFYLLRNL